MTDGKDYKRVIINVGGFGGTCCPPAPPAFGFGETLPPDQ
jgi:hypothetical protein